ncbi:MAG: GH3 auxin-responsive promoter family protein, partial [Planctomycetota bacterium]
RRYYGDVVFRDHGLSASEGRMTTPLEDETCAGILDVGCNYYEFVPEEEHGTGAPTVLQAHELQRDRNYFLVMTTSSGIYRHDIHDVVRCVGFEGRAPVLEFLNKGASYSSMTGEKLSEFQVVSAVRGALDAAGIDAEHFTLAPASGDPPHYELLIDAEIEDATKRQLAADVDRRLAEANCEYENRLDTGRLDPITIRRIDTAAWDAFHQRLLEKRGGSVEQFKHPCLAHRFDFVNQVLGSQLQA